MLTEHPTFTEILSLWKGPTGLAADMGLPPHLRNRVDQWRRRNFVHPKYWPRLIDAARKVHGIELTPEQLMAAAAGEEKASRGRQRASEAA